MILNSTFSSFFRTNVLQAAASKKKDPGKKESGKRKSALEEIMEVGVC